MSFGKTVTQRRIVWPKIKIGHVAMLLVGLIASALSVAQSAALIGLQIPIFRDLGSSFYSWRADQVFLAEKLFRETNQPTSEYLISSSRRILAHSPTSARAMWLLAKGFESGGNPAGARRVMARADNLTRRDGAVQLWLGSDALRRREVAVGLDHFDKMLRTNPDAAMQMLPRMVGVIAEPEGRAALLPYVRADNAWYEGMLGAALNSQLQAADVSALLSAATVLPDSKTARSLYRNLVSKLANERSYRSLLQLWPKLPGASDRAWQTIEPRPIVESEAYPPVDWSFAAFGNRRTELRELDGGEIGLEAFASPGTTGVSATKLLRPSDGARSLEWRVIEQISNPGGSAFWQVTCINEPEEGDSVQSVNLLSEAQQRRRMRMDLPENCPFVRVDLRISGGIGREDSRLLIDGILVSSQD